MKMFQAKGQTITSKFKKYESRNPILKHVTNNFFYKVGSLLSTLSFKSLLDVGCGDGVLMFNLQNNLVGKTKYGIDIDALGIEIAKKNNASAHFAIASVYDLPFPDNEFDLVLCCEVLEHLDPSVLNTALMEIRRVAAKYCVFTVPREPLWRLLNLLRGAYITDFGNTPGHTNHWNTKAFKRKIGDFFTILQIIKPFPWLGILCCKKNDL